MGEIVLCSNCFRDHGLKLAAFEVGQDLDTLCPNCGDKTGKKLDRKTLSDLAQRFFVNGSYERTAFGGASVLASNPYRYGEREVSFPSWLLDDAHLIEDQLKIGYFYYGPPLWRVGEIDPLKALQHPEECKEVLDRIVKEYPTIDFTPDQILYRLRKDPEPSSDPNQFDAPPDEFLGNGRLDGPKFPVFYASQDIEVCVHECRVTMSDRLFLATLRPTRTLKLLDLTADIEEDGTPFESLNLALGMLFWAEEHSYTLGRSIAAAAHAAGFDGIAYPSYFIPVRGEFIPNLGIFGRPITDGVIEIDTINRLSLRRVKYETEFGAAGYEPSEEETQAAMDAIRNLTENYEEIAKQIEREARAEQNEQKTGEKNGT